MSEIRFCKFCAQEKNIIEFTNTQIKNKNPKCKQCVSLYDAKYRILNKNKIKENRKKYYKLNSIKVKEKVRAYYKLNKEKISKISKSHREKNKGKLKKHRKQYYEINKENILFKNKEYRKQNKEKIKKISNKYRKQYRKEKLASDPFFKLRQSISHAIWAALKKQSSSKNHQSCLKYLPYNIQELKEHLEKQFSNLENLDNNQVWMTWANHGIYRVGSWDKNNSSTWTWQIDHIIPQSDLPYTSMEDNNFKKCWSLNNLRPLRADLNIIEGTSRTRHGPYDK